MLVPQFTVRRLFCLITVCAGIFLIVSLARQGGAWAVAISAAVAGLIATFTIYIGLFAVTWFVHSATVRVKKPVRPDSPFAQHRPPPQIIPEEVD